MKFIISKVEGTNAWSYGVSRNLSQLVVGQIKDGQCGGPFRDFGKLFQFITR